MKVKVTQRKNPFHSKSRLSKTDIDSAKFNVEPKAKLKAARKVEREAGEGHSSRLVYDKRKRLSQREAERVFLALSQLYNSCSWFEDDKPNTCSPFRRACVTFSNLLVGKIAQFSLL